MALAAMLGQPGAAIVTITLKDSAAVDEVAGTSAYAFTTSALQNCNGDLRLIEVIGASHSFRERLQNFGSCTSAGRVELIRTADSLAYTWYTPNTGAERDHAVLKRVP